MNKLTNPTDRQKKISNTIDFIISYLFTIYVAYIFIGIFFIWR